MNQLDIKSMTIEELEAFLVKQGQAKFRGKQLFDWLHKKKVRQLDHMVNMPKKLVESLTLSNSLVTLEEVNKLEDHLDGTIKYLFRLHDGHLVETVLMKYKYGYSVCISSQVGCKMGCTFCASTIGGLKRHLRPSEMLDQIYAIEKELSIEIHSVVVMGTGEPLDNYEHLLRFVQLLSHEQGRHLSRRHITISTCGIIDNIYRLSKDLPQVNLAISLHSPYNEKRREIMPVAAKYPLDQLMKACRDYVATTNRRITFEYSLIQGVNDDVAIAKDLAILLNGILCHVNLIPVNPVDERDFVAADNRHIVKFKEILEKAHIPTTVRRSLGQSIDAACGQLRNRYMKEDKRN